MARRLALLCDVAGGEEEAITYYEKAIHAGGQLETVVHNDLGTLLNNVALIYRRSGRQKAAEPYYLHALELYEKQLGPDHPDVAAVLNNLGVFYTNEGRFDEAETAHLRALTIRRQANPKGHSDIAQSQLQSRGGLSFARRPDPRRRTLSRISPRLGGAWRNRRRITRSSSQIMRIFCDR